MIPIQKVTHLEHHFRNLLLTVLPSELAIKIYSASRAPYLKCLSQYGKKMPPAKVTFNSQKVFSNSVYFRNDLGNAAGFDKDGGLLEFNYKLGAGFAIVGTALASAHTGNLIPAFGRQVNPWVPLSRSASALNSLGLPNKGIDLALENIKKFRTKYPDSKDDFPIGLSLMGHPLQDKKEQLAGLLECLRKSVGVVEFVEINESCPNCNHNEDQDLFIKRLHSIVELRNAQSIYLPIVLKLGSLDSAPENIRLFSELQVDGLALTNTQKNYPEFVNQIAQKDRDLFDYYTHKYQGGLSGKAIQSFSEQQIIEADREIIRQGSNLKLIHIGGLKEAGDITSSREIKSAVLREWYTGLLEKMGTTEWSKIYQNALASVV